MMSDLVREDCFCSIDEEERGLARRLGGGGADGPQHGLELIVLAPVAGLELLLEGPSLEASQDLRVGTFGLAIAPGVRYRSIADLCSMVAQYDLKRLLVNCEPLSVMMWLGTPKRLTRPLMNLTAEPAGMVRAASTSTHLVNLSMAT